MPDRAYSWPVVAALAAVLLLAAAAALVASQALARNFNLLVYLVISATALLDMADLAMRVYFCRRHAAAAEPDELGARQKRAHVRPFAIVASIHNAQDQLDEFMCAMAPYREHVWLIDDASRDHTALLLRAAGWNCIVAPSNLKKPGAVRALLATLPPGIETILVIDPDIRIRDASGEGVARLESLVFDFQRSRRAAACPRIAILEDGLLSRFQALEYCMSFSLGRRSLGEACITSGIALYRRADLEQVLASHSLSVYAEDLENSVLLLDAGRKIAYDSRLVVDTEGKRRWTEWFSQRVGWHYGLLRVYADTLPAIRAVSRRSLPNAYHFLVYTAVFTILMQPVKVAGLALIVLGFAQGIDGLLGLGLFGGADFADPAYIVAAWAKYTILALLAWWLAVPRGERRSLAPIVPLYFFYALAHIVPVTVGYANWVSLRLRGRRLFADHYQEEATMRGATRHG